MSDCTSERLPMNRLKFGLIGHPIAHSLSPALFKAGYGGEYTYDLIEEEDFSKAYDRFINGYDAINVTAPFKEMAYGMADAATPECRAIGAANILIRQDDGTVLAANSDHFGVIGAVRAGLQPGMKISPTALIAGCGGAAKAAAYAMGEAGYKTVILNRNLEKAVDFAGKLSAENGFDITAGPISDLPGWFRRAGIMIYTLPVATEEIRTLGDKDGGDKILVEANYRDPAFTPDILKRMKSDNPGFTYVCGQEWLLHQAVGAFQAFTGKEPNINGMRKVL